MFQGSPEHHQEAILQRLLRHAGVASVRVLLLSARALPALFDLGGDGAAEGRIAVSMRHPAASDHDSLPWTADCTTIDGYLENILRCEKISRIRNKSNKIYVHFRANVLDRLPAQSLVAPESRRGTSFRGVYLPCHHAASINAKFFADDIDFHHSAVFWSR